MVRKLRLRQKKSQKKKKKRVFEKARKTYVVGLFCENLGVTDHSLLKSKSNKDPLQ